MLVRNEWKFETVFKQLLSLYNVVKSKEVNMLVASRPLVHIVTLYFN